MQNDLTAIGRVEDEVMVGRALAGDNGAFSELIRRHITACTKVAYSIVRNETEAEDEVQNACWKAYVHLGQFQKDAKFSTWLTRIVVNQCLMRLRQVRRARLVSIDEPVEEDARRTELRDVRSTPEQAVSDVQVSAVMTREIRRIPPLLRHVFVLRDVEDLPMEDVADRLGISVAAAKSRLLRARQELKNRMAKHCGRLGPATLLRAS
jgi:RNA polymerase sigma-70 factor (ECF subfamily)